MKLNVKITAQKVSQDIVIPVGDGKQTFKWLALAAAHRFVSDGARHGQHIAFRHDRYALPARTNLLPKNVSTNECPFLLPNDIINEKASDGHTVYVDLYKSTELDDYGTPVLSDWAFTAFRNHERHSETRKKLVDDMAQNVESFQRDKSERARLRKIEIETPKIIQMKKVMEHQIMNDALIEAVMNKEWDLIKHSGILDNMVPDPNQQDEIKAFFVRNYLALTDMYKFYSAVNSGGGTHTLEYIELCKFITETGILGEEHSTAILKIFIDSHIRGMKGKGSTSSKPSIHSEICRTEFFVALIKIAVYKKITIPKKEIAKLRRSGQSVSLHQTIPSVPAALGMIYDCHLLPVVTSMPAGSDMRNAIASDEVLLAFHDKRDQLSKVFKRYADFVNSGDSSREATAGSMTCKKFGTFAKDAGFLGGVEVFSGLDFDRSPNAGFDTPKTGVTPKDVRQIFAASQHDFDFAEDDNGVEEGIGRNDSDQELMVFSEFLEGIARLGVLKYGRNQYHVDSEEKKLPSYECIKLALEKFCSIV